MKQIEIFDEISSELKTDETISGIMLMGSVSHGTAQPGSDLDIMILGYRNEFRSEIIDGILVEYSYITYETGIQKIMNNDMDVYHYLSSRIEYDKNGELKNLMDIAAEKYDTFITPQNIKNQIAHWLVSVKIKLTSALTQNDFIKVNFITATNSWKVIEAVWAVNNKPVPPSGSVMRYMNEMIEFPAKDWFELLFSGEDISKAETMIKIIDWALPELRN